MTIEQLYTHFQQNPSVSTDTRKIKRGDIFFALKGPHFNANEFAAKALADGASLAVVDDERYAVPPQIVMVHDVLGALQQLAAYHRSRLNIAVLAITGSNGKTTTKELVHAVLCKKFNCSTTEGNLNNHIGVPLTLLKIGAEAEIAVVEMGANHLHEIEGYCRYTKPTHGLITNIGKAHLEGFGSEEGVRRGKGELFDYLRGSGGAAFVHTDSAALVQLAKGIPEIITYGTGRDASVQAKLLDGDGLLGFEVVKGADIGEVRTKLVGAYNLPNALAAVAVGKTFGVRDGDIKEALQNYTPSNSRSQLLIKGTNKYILDAYNANPSSMKAAIQNLAAMPGENKVAVLGSMMELGADSASEHKNVVNLLKSLGLKNVLLAGPGYKNDHGLFDHVDDSVQAAAWLDRLNPSGSVILIKGSRGMQMEKALEG